MTRPTKRIPLTTSCLQRTRRGTQGARPFSEALAAYDETAKQIPDNVVV